MLKGSDPEPVKFSSVVTRGSVHFSSFVVVSSFVSEGPDVFSSLRVVRKSAPVGVDFLLVLFPFTSPFLKLDRFLLPTNLVNC